MKCAIFIGAGRATEFGANPIPGTLILSQPCPEPSPLLIYHLTQTGSSYSLSGALMGGDTDFASSWE